MGLDLLAHVEDPQGARPRVGDEQLPLVGGEDQPVRRAETVHDQPHLARGRIDSIDVVGADLALRAVPHVVAGDAEVRVGEADRTVGLHRRVVRAVQALALPSVGQHGDGAVVFGSGHPAVALLAGDQPALAVEAFFERPLSPLPADQP